MQTFTLDPNGFKEVWRKTLRFTVPLMLLAFSFPWVIAALGDRPSPGESTPILIALFVAVFAFSLFRSMKRQKQLWETYELTVDGDTISRKQDNTPIITLNRSEIVEIIENAEGHLQIKTAARTNFITVPSSIREREALIKLLASFGTINKQSRKSVNLLAFLIPVVFVFLMVVLYTATDKKIILASGTLLSLGLIWSFIEMQRSKHLDKRIKRASYFIFLVLYSIIATMWAAFNTH